MRQARDRATERVGQAGVGAFDVLDLGRRSMIALVSCFQMPSYNY